MKTVRVNKRELQDILQKNAGEHVSELRDARVGWRNEFRDKLQEQLDRMAVHNLDPENVHLPPPSDHTKDYARAISMINMSADDVIELDVHEFNRYVLDEWEWAHDKLRNALYASSAIR